MRQYIKPPRAVNPEQPAEVRTMTRIGDGMPPRWRAVIRCDDGEQRVFECGPEGRWVLASVLETR